MRVAQEAREQAAELVRTQEIEAGGAASTASAETWKRSIAALHAELEDEANAVQAATKDELARVEREQAERRAMQSSRKASARADAAEGRRPQGGGKKRSNGSSKQGARTS